MVHIHLICPHHLGGNQAKESGIYSSYNYNNINNRKGREARKREERHILLKTTRRVELRVRKSEFEGLLDSFIFPNTLEVID